MLKSWGLGPTPEILTQSSRGGGQVLISLKAPAGGSDVLPRLRTRAMVLKVSSQQQEHQQHWELVRNADARPSWVLSRGVEPSDLCFKEPACGFEYPIGFEICCGRGYALIHISLCWLALVVRGKTSLCRALTYQEWLCFWFPACLFEDGI